MKCESDTVFVVVSYKQCYHRNILLVNFLWKNSLYTSFWLFLESGDFTTLYLIDASSRGYGNVPKR